MQILLTRLYRERRRFLVVAALWFLGIVLRFGFDNGPTTLSSPSWLIAPVLSALSFASASVVFALLLPKLRYVGEALALGAVLGVAMGFGTFGIPLWSGAFLIFLTVVVYFGRVFDQFFPQRPATFHSTAKSRLSPDILWHHLAVTPDSPKAVWGATTLDCVWIEPGKRFVETHRYGALARIDEVKEILTFDRPERFACSFTYPDAMPGAQGAVGAFDVTISQAPKGCATSTVRRFDRLSVRAIVLRWIDDTAGRTDDLVLRECEFEARADNGGQLTA